jgi:hypothetical protein
MVLNLFKFLFSDFDNIKFIFPFQIFVDPAIKIIIRFNFSLQIFIDPLVKVIITDDL